MSFFYDAARESDLQNEDEGTAPQIEMRLQYVKALAIENPAPAEILMAGEDALASNFDLDVRVDRLGEEIFDVQLVSQLAISKKDQVLFSMQMVYAGLCAIQAPDENVLQLLVFVQAPSLLFPTKRHLVRTLTQEAGLPVFNLQDVNFMELFQIKAQQAAQDAGDQASGFGASQNAGQHNKSGLIL
jgi:preprotein translocase subunit SecB